MCIKSISNKGNIVIKGIVQVKLMMGNSTQKND